MAKTSSDSHKANEQVKTQLSAFAPPSIPLTRSASAEQDLGESSFSSSTTPVLSDPLIAQLEIQSLLHAPSSAPWTAAEDSSLLQFRSEGMDWNEMAEQCLPNRSPVACRARHEYLIKFQKRGDNRDDDLLPEIAISYQLLRQEIWQPLAKRTGKPWDRLEQIVSFFGSTAFDWTEVKCRSVWCKGWLD